MPTLRLSIGGKALLDIASYARHGLGRRDRLSLAEVEHISRTVRRVPEAVVKVLSRDSNKLASVGKHVNYIGRHGELDLETDDGEQLRGKDLGRQLIEDWDLDVDEHRRVPDLGAASGRVKPKLVHKLMLSMPPGTAPQGVVGAARNFLREEFALKHRYAFVLHTDEPHPHVHAMVKAVSEQGVRLHIKKATLREWRSEFARHLRNQGIEANATERAVRGESAKAKKDGIYRAHARGSSSYMRGQTEAISVALSGGALPSDTGKRKLVETRAEIMRGWIATAHQLARQGERELASAAVRYANGMDQATTDRERIAYELLAAHQVRQAAIKVPSEVSRT
jgi:hypothetical protein